MSDKEPQMMIPWVEISADKLPSRGLAYPKAVKVRYRTYSFGEIKMVSAGNPGIVQLVENTLKGVETTAMAKDQLTLLDVLYIGVLRKISSLSETEYTVPFICEDCGTADTARFSDKQLEFKSIDEAVTELPAQVEIQGKVLQFFPLTVKNFLLAQKGRWQKDIVGGEVDRCTLTALMIKNLDFKEAYDLLFSLRDASDIEVVEEIDNLLLHDLKPIKVVCKADLKGQGKICNHENQVVLSGREQLIRPFREGERPVRSRIHFGVPQPSEHLPHPVP